MSTSNLNYPYLNSLVQTIYLQHDHPAHAHLFLLHSVCTPTEGWIVRLYEWGELASRETNLLHASASASKDKGKGRAMGEAEGKGEGGREGEMEMGCKCWEGGWKGKKELRDLESGNLIPDGTVSGFSKRIAGHIQSGHLHVLNFDPKAPHPPAPIKLQIYDTHHSHHKTPFEIILTLTPPTEASKLTFDLLHKFVSISQTRSSHYISSPPRPVEVSLIPASQDPFPPPPPTPTKPTHPAAKATSSKVVGEGDSSEELFKERREHAKTKRELAEMKIMLETLEEESGGGSQRKFLSPAAKRIGFSVADPRKKASTHPADFAFADSDDSEEVSSPDCPPSAAQPSHLPAAPPSITKKLQQAAGSDSGTETESATEDEADEGPDRKKAKVNGDDQASQSSSIPYSQLIHHHSSQSGQSQSQSLPYRPFYNPLPSDQPPPLSFPLASKERATFESSSSSSEDEFGLGVAAKPKSTMIPTSAPVKATAKEAPTKSTIAKGRSKATLADDDSDPD